MTVDDDDKNDNDNENDDKNDDDDNDDDEEEEEDDICNNSEYSELHLSPGETFAALGGRLYPRLL